MLYTDRNGATSHAHAVVPVQRVPAKREAIAAFQRLVEAVMASPGAAQPSQALEQDFAILHDFIHSR